MGCLNALLKKLNQDTNNQNNNNQINNNSDENSQLRELIQNMPPLIILYALDAKRLLKY